jgi:transcriptional regulator with XRE-family HTH domain
MTRSKNGNRPPTMGENIRTLRELRGWTQQQLADEIGQSQVAISQWETSEREPDLSNVKRLAKALGCSLIEIVPEAD